jgi:hypothetical protein
MANDEATSFISSTIANPVATARYIHRHKRFFIMMRLAFPLL